MHFDRRLENSSLDQFLSKKGAVEGLICVLTFLAYVSTLFFGFVYDDKPVIVDSVVIRSWRLLAHYFIPQIPAEVVAPASGSFYRPITLLWLRLNYFTFGLRPAGWHFAMLMGHVLMTYLVFLVVERLAENRSTAAIAALLFGLHPVHVENVAWLSSVSDLLVAVFMLGSFFAYLGSRNGKRLWMGVSLILFALALLSKETAAVLPILVLGFELLFSRADGNGKSKQIPALQRGQISVPYFAVLALFLVVRKSMLHGSAQALAPIGWSTMLLTAPSILWFDLKHLLFPISASEFYALSYVTKPNFEDFGLPIFLLIGVLAVVAYCISKLRNPRLGIFALAWATLTILPSLYLRGIAPGNFVHDRFLYLPSVGLVILVALLLERIFATEPFGQNNTAAEWGVVTVLCIAACAATLKYQEQWASNLSLYQNAVKYAPQNPIVLVNLANEYANRGRLDQALPLYLSAVQRDPGSWLSNYNLGYEYYRTGKYPEAEDYLERAIQIDDKDPDQFIYLARAQQQQGKLAQAEQNAMRALQRGPLSPGFHFVLGTILEASGERARAIAEYRAEVLTHPENGLARSQLQRLQSSP